MKSAALSTLIFATDLLACPYCVGNGQGGKDSNTTLVLGLFILSTYIPYYIIFRLIKKHRDLKAKHDSPGSAIP
jgi:hypothetical protein